ncbi:MAG: hypothetical protein QW835_01940, partial [Candidatus Hadarchaeum sp.]
LPRPTLAGTRTVPHLGQNSITIANLFEHLDLERFINLSLLDFGRSITPRLTLNLKKIKKI